MNKTLVIKSPSIIDADLLGIDEFRVTAKIGKGHTSDYLIAGENVNLKNINNAVDFSGNNTSIIRIPKTGPSDDTEAVFSILNASEITEFHSGLNVQSISSIFGDDIAAVQIFDPNKLTFLSLYGSKVSGDISALSGMTNLQTLNLNATSVSGDISALSGMTNLQTLNLNTSVSGDISALSTSISEISNLNGNTKIIGDISHLTNLSKWAELGGTQIYGELSACYKLLGITAPNGRMTWSSSTARSSKTNIPLFVSNSVVSKGLQLGNDLDNFLLDEAACTNVSGNTLTPKKIVATGTHTSVSDAAITTLQNAGITVTIYES